MFCGDPWNAEEKASLHRYVVLAQEWEDPAPGLTKAGEMYVRCWERWDARD